MSSRVLNLFVALGLTAALAACSSPVRLDEPAGGPAQQTGTGSSSTGVGSGSVDPMDPFNPQSPLARQSSVFFEFDSYAVAPEYRDVVEMHGRYLASKPNQQVVIEGHTDERGSSEYNLALGQRRSEAVRRMLLVLGVRDDQVEAVSMGKEHPRATAGTDADHAQNRRADFVYRR